MKSGRLSLPRNSILSRTISRHLSEYHASRAGNVSRRKFLEKASGLAGLAFWIPRSLEAS